MKLNTPYISTTSGRKFDFNNIISNDIHLEDIVNSLVNVCRFNGHVKRFYSVASHLLLTEYIAANTRGISYNSSAKTIEAARMRLYLLLHDAHEAYVGDLTRPVKDFLANSCGVDLNALTDQVDDVIYRYFSIPSPTATEKEFIKKYDDAACILEQYYLRDERVEGLEEYLPGPPFFTMYDPKSIIFERNKKTIATTLTAKIIDTYIEYLDLLKERIYE